MTSSQLLQDLPALTVRCVSVSSMANNVYLLTEKASGAQVLIDAANDFPAIEALLESAAADSLSPTKLQLIATTHSHFDHVQALAQMVASSGAPAAAGAPDAESIKDQTGVVMNTELQGGESLRIGGLVLETVLLRGHTPGSIAYVLATEGPDGAPLTLIFSGDSLFPGGVGNTNSDPARFEQLLGDVTDKLFNVYPDAVVFPGHGASTTLATERPALPVWRERGW